MTDPRFLSPTRILDFHHPDIESLVTGLKWREPERGFDRIQAVYAFVRDEIAFGYNRSDDIAASEVLKDRYGQCNTKATLMMALLRAVGVPCRLRGATIHKDLQRGAVSGIWYALAPSEIIHTWVEVCHEDEWIGLEGVILDKTYIDGVRALVPNCDGPFTGYAMATRDLAAPDNEWVGRPTEIQAEGIARHYGVFDSPDDFYARHGVNLPPFRRLLYASLVRHRLNKRVASIRAASKSGAGCHP